MGLRESAQACGLPARPYLKFAKEAEAPNIQTMRSRPNQTCQALLRGGFIALAILLCMPPVAPASPPMPRVPPEAKPAAWQRAGIEAALKDPDLSVQYHALDCCRRKQWVAQLHLPTSQWLQWLAHSDQEVRALAAQAAGQLGAQMPAEVQLTLARLRKTQGMDSRAQQAATHALLRLGTGMIPEVQLELVAALHETAVDYDLMLPVAQAFAQALGELGSSMAPATLQALLSLMQSPPAAGGANGHAADALARLGLHMPPKVRELMLSTLLDPRADSLLRSTAAEAMGRLGPQMPAQARQFLLSVLRDPHSDSNLRNTAPAALAQLGPQMPPEVQQALLAVYDEPPPPNADEDTTNSHFVFHQHVVESLKLAGPGMPPALQQGLLERFLKSARPPQAQPQPHPYFSAMMERSRLGAELSILEHAGAHASPDFLHTVLGEFLGPTLSNAARESLAWHVLQPLARRGGLPQEVQQTLLTCLQDEKARLETRRQAAHTLGCLGAGASPEARQALLAILQDPKQKPTLRYHALLGMQALGAHMPPEAVPVLVGILQRNTNPPAAPRTEPAAPPFTGPDPFGEITPPSPGTPPAASITPPATPAPPPSTGFDPFAPNSVPPSASTAPAPAPPAPAASPDADDVNTADEFSIEVAVPTLGNLGPKMPAEAQTALLGVIQHGAGPYQTRWDAAYALARMGDKLPPQTQQRLLALLNTPGPDMDYALRLAIRQTLGVSGIYPITDAQVAELIAKTYEAEPDAGQRFYLHLWLGRNPAHLQAVRWLGHTDTDPPLGDTPPQEVLALISRFWPHSAGADAPHTALRQAMARRTRQILTTHLKSHPLDEPLRKALLPLATQLAEDPAADCATALRDVQSALTAGEKAR